MQRHHDMGGLAAGPIERHEHDQAPWEKQVDAIVRLLLAKNRISLDQLRRGIEELGPGAYDAMSYFERWMAATTNLLLEQGLVTVEELGEAIAAAQARAAGSGRPVAGATP